MLIKINGDEKEICEITTIEALVSSKELMPERIIIEYNGRILKRAEWIDIEIKENDNIEIVSFVGGG